MTGFRSHRSREAQTFDAFCDQATRIEESVNKLLDHMGHSQNQTVYHVQKGMGSIGIVCAAICGLCVLFLILGSILIVPELHDAKAWLDILRRDVARLQAGQQTEKGK